METTRRDPDIVGALLTIAIVLLTLATAYIHSTLGSPLFYLNTLGYVVLAVALVAPLDLARRFRWLIRIGLLLFTLGTIGGWIVFGARYDVAYIAKGIEVVLVILIVWSIYRYDGGLRVVMTRLRGLRGELASLRRGDG
jgi:hypothetical protein